MNGKLRASLRLLAIFGLYIVLSLAIPLAWVFDKLSGGSLTVAEKAKAKLAELRGAK